MSHTYMAEPLEARGLPSPFPACRTLADEARIHTINFKPVLDNARRLLRNPGAERSAGSGSRDLVEFLGG